MRILIVSAMFPPIQTGTSFYCRNIAIALSSLGHQVEVVALENAGAVDAHHDFPVHRLKAIHAPLKSYFKHLRIASPFPGNYSRLRQIAASHKTDVILLVNHYLDIAFPCIYAASSNRIPLICSVGTPLQSPNPARERALNALDRLICGDLIFSRCDRIICWDENIVQYITDVHGVRFRDRLAIVNYGVNGDSRAFLDYRHDYSHHGQILCVGAVIEQRDYVSLVKAFHAICRDVPNVGVKIIGHVYHDAAVKLAERLGISDRVVFTGERPHREVLDELTKSDVFYSSMSGKYLGMGTATIEAMLMGIPALVNVTADHLGGPLLRDMEDIAIANGLQPEIIAERLRMLLLDDQLRRRVGQGGRQFVAKFLNWEKVATDMERVFMSVLKSRSGTENVCAT